MIAFPCPGTVFSAHYLLIRLSKVWRVGKIYICGTSKAKQKFQDYKLKGGRLVGEEKLSSKEK